MKKKKKYRRSEGMERGVHVNMLKRNQSGRLLFSSFSFFSSSFVYIHICIYLLFARFCLLVLFWQESRDAAATAIVVCCCCLSVSFKRAHTIHINIS